MKDKWYRSNWIKAVLAVMFVALFTLAACCSVSLEWLMAQNHYTLGESRKGYVSSKVFADELLGDSGMIIRGLNAQEMLVEKTTDGEDLLIDLQAVADTAGENYAYGNISGLAYTVADLKKWSRQGWHYGDEDGSGGIIVCHQPNGKYTYYYYNEFVRLFMEGELKFVVPDIAEEDAAYLENYTLEVLSMFRNSGYSSIPSDVRAISDAKGTIKYVDFWNYGDSYIKEEYTPAGAKNLLDVVNNKKNWNGRLNEVFYWLGVLLDRFESAQAYAQIPEQFREGNTNIVYLYVDTEDRKIGTNCRQFENYSDYENYLERIRRDYGAYALIRPSLAECESTLNASMKQWQAELLGSGHGNCIFAIGVDTAFPVEDTYASNAQEYNRYAPWVEPLLAAAICSALLLLAAAVWLTVIAGRQAADGELHLFFFDRWCIELFVLFPLALWCLLWVACQDSLPIPGRRAFAALAIFAAGTALCFLTLYLSAVRRIKAKNLWRQSLCRFLLIRVQKLVRLFAGKTPGIAKVTLAVCAYFLLMLALFFNGNWRVYFAVLLLCCLALLFFCMKRANGQDRILDGLKRITEGEIRYKISSEDLPGEQKAIAEYINRIGDGLDSAMESSLKNERMKTELITNVSHDIKTPLTSIINYVDLLKRENLEDPKAREYIDVLEKKARRLKILTEDVVEASKISTGNITLEITDLDFLELVRQVVGEFRERFDENQLLLVTELPDAPVLIRADGRRMWRVLENVFGNAAKYAMTGTRVYVELKCEENQAVFSIKNISAQPLNFSADELTERFIRGDVARNTEGSGLGLSIAKSLTELQEGEFRVFVDGDLFHVSVTLPLSGEGMRV